LLLGLTNHYCAVGSSVQLNSVSQKTASRPSRQNWKQCETSDVHTQSWCRFKRSVTFRLGTSCRRFGRACCLHLDCQAVKQRYMIRSTLGFVSKPALLGMLANSCVEYDSVSILQW